MKHTMRGYACTTLIAILTTLAGAVLVAGCGGSGSSSSESSETTETTSKPPAEENSSEPVADNTPEPAAGDEFPDYSDLQPPSFTAPKGTKIAFLMPETIVPLQQAIIEGAEAAAKREGVDLKVFDAGGYVNVNKQVGQMETAIGEGFDGIMMVPSSPAGLNAQIKAARSAGIAVTADLVPPESEEINFALLGTSPEEGEILTRKLAESIGEEGQIFVEYGGEGSTPNIYFGKGVTKALKEFPKIEVVAQEEFPAFNPSESQTATENAVAAHPEVKGVLTNSTSLIPGVQRALKTAGLESLPAVGLGPNTSAEIAEIQAGTTVAATTPPFFKSGELLTEWTLAIIAGHEPKEKFLPVPSMVFTPDNIEEGLSNEAMFQSLPPSLLGCGPGESQEC